MSRRADFETVIGLEIHAQLLSRTKIFCGCSTAFGAAPNSQVCPVCLGLPGSLPVLNREAVRLAARAALALQLTVAPLSLFARKNYFYPDLPKGYQISQYDRPISVRGRLELSGGDADAPKRAVRIARLHLEEDAGKSIHPQGGGDESLIDLNRCGVPLAEIVTEPDLRSPGEAGEFVAALKEILEYTGVCDGNMEEGSLRCDANVSVRPRGAAQLGVKTEIKNLNSIKAVVASLEAEAARQARLVARGGTVEQATLLWDAEREVAVTMRTKEEAHDYRYFPEPDLAPLRLSPEFIAEQRLALPELPAARRARFEREFGMPVKDAAVLCANRALADYFEATLESYDPRRSTESARRAGNWVRGEVLRLLKEGGRDIAEFGVAPAALAELLRSLDEGTISNLSAKDVLAEMDRKRIGAVEAIDAGGHRQLSDTAALRAVVLSVIADHPGPVAQVRAGEEKPFGFLVGQLMRATQGTANPRIARELLREEIDKAR